MRTVTIDTLPLLDVTTLNRALLARQALIEPSDLPPLALIEHLGGLQSQAPNPPYIGLWTRLPTFQHEALSTLIRDRSVVRLALMRSTIHLVSADDSFWLRPLMQPVIERSFLSNHGKLLVGLDFDEIVIAGRAFLEERPRTFNELGGLLQERWPDRDALALSQLLRTYVTLVQVPPRGLWGQSGQALYTSVEAWLDRSADAEPDPARLFTRYLAAFGPASVRDAQTWSGLTGLRAVAERLRPELVSFRDEQSRELFDLPNAPRPDPETPVPIRYLPEFDSCLLSHADRSRIFAEEHKSRFFTSNGIVRGTVLIDGFVGAIWKINRVRGTATLNVELFAPQDRSVRREIVVEGERLLAFAADGATPYAVEITVIA